MYVFENPTFMINLQSGLFFFSWPVAGGIMASQKCPTLTIVTSKYVILHGQKDFANVIKVIDLNIV